MQKVYIVNGCRTDIGSFGGSLKDVSAARLGSIVIKEALNCANLSAGQVDEVFMGCVLTTALWQNPARQMSLGVGLPAEVPATTFGGGNGIACVVGRAK